MSLKILPKSEMSDWINFLLRDYRLIAPTLVQGEIQFGEIVSAEQVALDYKTTILPPKKSLLPQHESLLRFNLQENQVTPTLDETPTILFGIHTCDMHAMGLLDSVFSKEPTDQHYLARRSNTTLVSIECLQPCSENAFCKDMGTLSVPDEFDLHLVDIGDAFTLDTGSERGNQLVKGISHLHESSQQDQKQMMTTLSKKWSQFQYRLDMDITELKSLLTLSYKSTLWEELAERCLGCAGCTIVCPTCYCFDVQDTVDFSFNAGERVRVWDSCQLNQFATVAGGHDFRTGHANRQRHRFMRKYKYQSVTPGLVGCVGCGRCATACLVDITPVGVLNKLYHRHMSPNRKSQEEIVL